MKSQITCIFRIVNMESIPLPPPLPQLSMTESKHMLTEVNSKFSKNISDKSILDNLELWFKLNGKRNKTFLANWQNTPTILQNGPQCGLVALAMAAQSFGMKVDTDSIFQQAKRMGITQQGELFSSSAVCALASQININSVLLNKGFSDIQLLLRYFISGKLLLVPYDADCNHAPCLKKGHKAHWALVIGVFFEFENNLHLHSEICCKREILSEDLYRISDLSANCDLLSQVKKENIYFLAKHGKSKRLAIWNCESLQLSNNNLEEVDPKRSSSVEYVLPPNNKLSDLCGKIIVLG